MTRSVLRPFALLMILPLAALVAACGDSPTSPTTTSTNTVTTSSSTTTSTVSVTETFSGTLGSGGEKYHVFHTMPGVFSVTLASIDQSTNPGLGMAFGMWDGKTCSEVLTAPATVVLTSLPGTASIETDVCIRMWDPVTWETGFTLSYSVTVVHYAKS
jgi:hypothetical protein